MNPMRSVTDAVTRPLKAVYVVGLCFLINLMTTPGHWWVQWVALGMGIAVIAAWARAVRALVAAGALAAVAAYVYRRFGRS